MSEDYATSERLRRGLESERDELQEELNSLGGNRTNLAEEKRRLEARIQQVGLALINSICNVQCYGITNGGVGGYAIEMILATTEV